MPTSVLSFSSARLVKTGTWRLLGSYMQAVEAIGKVTADGRSCPVVELRASGTKTKHGNELSRVYRCSHGEELEAGKGLLTRSRGRRPFSRPHSSQRRGILGTWEQEIMGGKGQIGRCRLPRVQCDWEAWWSTMMAWQGVGEEL
uniref:Uncharacterized protein n=1 Tax=Oryza barthii TaxID=65489 RepID=A0A0D3G505_9ORYZ